jgi:4-diphosphocytidyl-2-C-methyl-D-erythritol kinase
MPLIRSSPAKINLLLNILGRRADGFHELETLLLPIPWTDELSVEQSGTGLRLTCDNPALPTGSGNLVHRAATSFLERAGIQDGVAIHLEKRVPLESGLGGGSSNAATTLLALNELFGSPLDADLLRDIAAGLGSDVPFFLGDGPAIATGRGERIEPLPPFSALKGVGIFLVHPGFGVSTVWAYQQMPRFPTATQGQPGRARRLADRLQAGDLHGTGSEFYNALEYPVLAKYPLLKMFQEFLRERDPIGVLMSGSGSTTFSLWPTETEAGKAERAFHLEFGETNWTAVGTL